MRNPTRNTVTRWVPMALRADERVAHCLVGPPRTLYAPCVQRALVDNFVASFAPARSHLFAAFSVAQRSSIFNVTHSSPLERLVSERAELEALGRAVGAVEVSILDALPTPACHEQHVATSRSYAVPAVMMGNVRRCFANVVQYERRQSLTFDYVTRVRPDAIFFARFPLPPRDVLANNLVVPIGGLGGICHA